jgi:hypothetical protein
MPTHFGLCTLEYKFDEGIGTMTFTGDASPPQGFVLAIPTSLPATVTVDGEPVPRGSDGRCTLPPKTKKAQLRFE